MRASALGLILLALILFSAGNLFAYENPWIYGIHDQEPIPEEYLNHIKSTVPGGWITATMAVGHDPNDQTGFDFSWFADRGVTVICRLNNGYFPNGTIPVPSEYANFAQRCANFVRNSKGCEIWIIGNELNIAGEWPVVDNHAAYVSPSSYASCYRQVYSAIKAVSPVHRVLPQPLAPFSGPFSSGYVGPYTHDANPLCWVDWMNQMLTQIKASGSVDGIALHVYSRGYSPSDVRSTYQRYISNKNLYWSFFCYKDWINYGIPSDLYHLPIYITECNGYYYWKGGHPENPDKHYEPGFMQAVYEEINRYNQEEAATQGKPVIRCVNMYRWAPHFDHWNIDGSTNPYKAQILSDLDEAVAAEYAWPGANLIPLPWSDDFNDSWIDDKFPEPDWSWTCEEGGQRDENGGFMKLTGEVGRPSIAALKNSKYRLYRGFTIQTKIHLVNTASTVGSDGRAEVRFRTSADGTGYSLTFSPSESTISLRRTDTDEIIQGKQVNDSLPDGAVRHIWIRCDGEMVKVKIGTSDGGSDAADWDFTDSAFTGKGCFWLVNSRMREVWFDYFSYQPLDCSVQGTVRDSLGNLMGNATISTDTGGYTTTTNPDGTYLLSGINPGVYNFTASKTNYTPYTHSNVQITPGTLTLDFTIVDGTVPTTPVVSVVKPYQTSTDSLTFSWQPSSDPESGIKDYRCAISYTPDILGIVPGGSWQMAGLVDTHTRAGLNLNVGQEYFGLVRAVNYLNKVSPAGVSPGVRIVEAVESIPDAKKRPDGAWIALPSKVVTAVFPDCVYVQELDCTSGIRVNKTGAGAGTLLDVSGRMLTINGERRVNFGIMYPLQSTPIAVPKPIAMQNKTVGGEDLNPHTPGVSDGFGANNIGLYVTIWGRVKQSDPASFVISDGRTERKVLTTTPPPAAETYVLVTGVVSTEQDASGTHAVIRATSVEVVEE